MEKLIPFNSSLTTSEGRLSSQKAGCNSVLNLVSSDTLPQKEYLIKKEEKYEKALGKKFLFFQRFSDENLEKKYINQCYDTTKIVRISLSQMLYFWWAIPVYVVLYFLIPVLRISWLYELRDLIIVGQIVFVFLGLNQLLIAIGACIPRIMSNRNTFVAIQFCSMLSSEVLFNTMRLKWIPHSMKWIWMPFSTASNGGQLLYVLLHIPTSDYVFFSMISPVVFSIVTIVMYIVFDDRDPKYIPIELLYYYLLAIQGCLSNYYIEKQHREAFFKHYLVEKRKVQLKYEYERTINILHNVLPNSFLDDIQHDIQIGEKRSFYIKSFPNGAILQTDLHGFTDFTSKYDSNTVVKYLNHIYSLYDQFATVQLALEKVKTLGDGYIVACYGNKPDDVVNLVLFGVFCLALRMKLIEQKWNPLEKWTYGVRVGIAMGNIQFTVSGAIEERYSFDVHGKCVQEADEREQNCQLNKVFCGKEVYEKTKDVFEFDQVGDGYSLQGGFDCIKSKEVKSRINLEGIVGTSSTIHLQQVVSSKSNRNLTISVTSGGWKEKLMSKIKQNIKTTSHVYKFFGLKTEWEYMKYVYDTNIYQFYLITSIFYDIVFIMFMMLRGGREYWYVVLYNNPFIYITYATILECLIVFIASFFIVKKFSDKKTYLIIFKFIVFSLLYVNNVAKIISLSFRPFVDNDIRPNYALTYTILATTFAWVGTNSYLHIVLKQFLILIVVVLMFLLMVLHHTKMTGLEIFGYIIDVVIWAYFSTMYKEFDTNSRTSFFTDFEIKEKEDKIKTEKERNEKIILSVIPMFCYVQMKKNSLKSSLGGENHQMEMVQSSYIGGICFIKLCCDKTNFDSDDEYFTYIYNLFAEFTRNIEFIEGGHRIKVFASTILFVYLQDDGEKSETVLSKTLDCVLNCKRFFETKKFYTKNKSKKQNETIFKAGVNYGEFRGGTIGGFEKSSFDIFGLSVNISSRLCSTTIPNSIQIRAETIGIFDSEESKKRFSFQERGETFLKGAGTFRTFTIT